MDGPAVTGLLSASCRCTVMVPEATPAMVLTAVEVIASWVAAFVTLFPLGAVVTLTVEAPELVNTMFWEL